MTYFGIIHWAVHEILFYSLSFLILVTAEAAILDCQFVEKNDINLKHFHLQIILSVVD